MSDYLDRICEIVPFTRQTYGSDIDNKPNDHCYWDDLFMVWEENDKHFRSRLMEFKNDM